MTEEGATAGPSGVRVDVVVVVVGAGARRREVRVRVREWQYAAVGSWERDLELSQGYFRVSSEK
jgi:hypothetical protein